jgi:hypothetical protein
MEFAEFTEFRSSKILVIPGFPEIFGIWKIKFWNLKKKFLKSREFQEFLKYTLRVANLPAVDRLAGGWPPEGRIVMTP